MEEEQPRERDEPAVQHGDIPPPSHHLTTVYDASSYGEL